MQNVSEEFKQAIKEPARELKSKIELPGLTITDKNISKIDLDSSLVFSEDFEIGTAPMDTSKIELIVDDWEPISEDILEYNFEDKECNIELGVALENESIEYASIGKYTVEKAVKKNNKITLDCVDRMYKAEKDFENNLMFPTTINEILQSACEQSGITLATTNFTNANYVVSNEPVFENITCRHIFAQVAELAGGYAKINRAGELEIIILGNTVIREITKDHYIELKKDKVSVGKIDRVIVKVGEETAEQGEGENIYTIVDNMFVQDPNNVIGPVFNVLKNVSYSSCDFEWQGDFSLDLGDKITIDGYDTYVLDRKLKYTGGLREDYKAPAKSNVEKNSTGKGSLTIDMNNVKTQIKVIDGEIRQVIERVENLVSDAANRLYQSQTNIPFDLNVGTGTVQLFRNSYYPYYKVTSDTNIDLSASFPNSQFAEPLEELGEATISLDVLVEVDRVVIIDGEEHEAKANRWTRIHVTKEFTENNTRNIIVRNPYSRKRTRDKYIGTKLIEQLQTNINTIYYRNLQVQGGNVASRWTLTPEELEEQVNRISSEFKQLEYSISLLVRKNDDSGRFEVNADNIVAEINKTDGVGKVKTIGVTVDENGLAIDNGAIIIRDSNNTAIITSDGLKIMFTYTSSGELNGWQFVGVVSMGGLIDKRSALLIFSVPEKLNITKATLNCFSMPAWRTGETFPDGFYHARNLRLYKSSDPSDGYLDFPAASNYGVTMRSASYQDITDDVWEVSWTPSGDKIVNKIGDVTNHITPGQQHIFAVETTDAVNVTNARYMGAMQLNISIEGYLRG
ncbi:hypothetical protein GOQ29_04970 [Clostridium sp. D2Q-14]|uniref:hypothetical protein n=1 Tax=Anaeromonas gelatinilytica TaxID=2683194 RepID=UPI00193C5BB6|nr:hypothetical protein [Anaeromonas gelatinilytica]MBS4534968.1 hypothetical protein [Anaeromonas gelatinilytica]